MHHVHALIVEPFLPLSCGGCPPGSLARPLAAVLLGRLRLLLEPPEPLRQLRGAALRAPALVRLPGSLTGSLEPHRIRPPSIGRETKKAPALVMGGGLLAAAPSVLRRRTGSIGQRPHALVGVVDACGACGESHRSTSVPPP